MGDFKLDNFKFPIKNVVLCALKIKSADVSKELTMFEGHSNFQNV